MSEVKYIEVIFENCESMIVKRHLLGVFRIAGIHDIIGRVASNSIQKYQAADEVVMEILPKAAETEYHAFGMEKYKSTLMKRLSEFNDITHIDVHYEDGTQDSFAVDYCEENESLGAPNINQKTFLSLKKHLFIVIAAGKKVEDYFSQEEISQLEDMPAFYESEKFDWGTEGFPDYYRCVYVDTKDKPYPVLAVRIPGDGDGKIIPVFTKDDDNNMENLHRLEESEPMSWSYPKSSLEEEIMRRDGDYVIQLLLAVKPDKEDDVLTNAWNQSYEKYKKIMEEIQKPETECDEEKDTEQEAGKHKDSKENEGIRKILSVHTESALHTVGKAAVMGSEIMGKTAEKSEKIVTQGITAGSRAIKHGVAAVKEAAASKEAEAVREMAKETADKCIVKVCSLLARKK